MSLLEVKDYHKSESFKKIKKFSKDKPTPFVVDESVVEKHYDDLEKNFPYAKVYYAMKANPEI